MLVNGDFEAWAAGALAPDGWFLYRDGRDSAVVGVTGGEVFSGERAVRLEGRTYLYQDVAVEAGEWYAIRVRVNAPGDEVRWRCFCSWRRSKSEALGPEYNAEIRTLDFQERTDGWVEVFPGKVFQAPAEARWLRVELRTYGKEWVYGEGVYLDDCSVEWVDAGISGEGRREG